MDNLITGRAENVEDLIGERFRLVHVDVTDYLHVSGPVDAVLHFASPASPIDYLRYPIQTLKVGALGTHRALGLAKDKGARFLLASTSEVYVDDMVEGFWRLLWSDVEGPVNLGNPREVTILELAQMVAAAAGVGEVRVDYQPRPVDDPEVRRPDITRAMTELDWKPSVTLEEGIERTLPWFREALERAER